MTIEKVMKILTLIFLLINFKHINEIIQKIKEDYEQTLNLTANLLV